MIKHIWTEEKIREELVKLDNKTGLNSATSTIRFNSSKFTLGSYCPGSNGGKFCFSNYFFEDPEWPVELALDVIRHEYAHFMAITLYNDHSHGILWKKCCRTIGALPICCYRKQRELYYQKKRTKEDKLSKSYTVGLKISHPKYGVGVITEISFNRNVVTVDFDIGSKKLLLEWVDEHCGLK